MHTNYPRISRRGLITAAATAPAVALFNNFGATAVEMPRTKFGVNFYSLFLRSLQPNGIPAVADLVKLAKSGISFVRFPASGQRASDWSILDNNPTAYWSGMDAIFSAAQESGINLVASIFWNPPTLPFHLGETMQDWIDPNSRTSRYAKNYCDAFVTRYDQSPALLMYEFGNELNTWTDLPNLTKFWPKPDSSVPERKPLPRDFLTSWCFRGLGEVFSHRLRARSAKAVGMGTDNPRNNAWHLARQRYEMDTRSHYIEHLRAITPSAADVMSIHLYPHEYGQKNTVFDNAADNLSAMVDAARLDRRLAFVGEFGVPRSADYLEERRQFEGLMASIVSAGVDYAALWNYAPFPMQPEFDVTFTNERAYQLEAIRGANGA